ncbi:AAA family ATPase [Microbacterium gilvum]|uniref:AAA family ATPase n=2 Tax=Microbacterium gilvum TaxID=1336204 RepID=A0ABP9ARD3_9MICO
MLAELAARGHRVVDTDYDGWTDGNGGPWDEERMSRLLGSEHDVIVSGTSENQGRFYDRFTHVVLLSAPVDVLLERVRQRVNNPYGHSPAQQDEIRDNAIAIEPLLRASATLELDAQLPVPDLADAIESLLE